MKKPRSIFLTLIIFGAGILRLVNLANVPVGFHGDEAAIGYNAYALLNTGRDVNNILFPVVIDQWGDKRPAGLHYLTIPAIAIFGLTEFATRLPAAIFGIATVILFYFFVKDVFGDKNLAILAALLLAISPWHIVTSRATSESIVSMFFMLAAVWTFFLALKNRDSSKRFLLVSLVLFGMSFWFYHASRVFVPLFVGVVVFVKNTRVPWGYVGVLIALILILLVAGGTSRPKNVSIFTSPQTQLIVDEQLREQVNQPILVKRLLHNKFAAYIQTFSRNYLAHFTGTFLALEGGGPARYIVPWQGMMYLIDLPFLMIGCAWILYQGIWKRNRRYQAILLWLFLAPVPAALTFEDIPNVQRAILMVPSLIIITSVGIRETIRLVRSERLFISLIFLAYGYSLLQFGDAYFFHTFTHQPWHRNVGEKELVFYINNQLKQGKKIVATASFDNNPLFYLFFLKMPPQLYQQLAGSSEKANKLLPNLRFIVQDCPGLEEAKDADTYIIGIGECHIGTEAALVDTIRRTDGTAAFTVYQPRLP